MKITGHGNRHSIKSYLEIDSGHQQEIIDVMRSVSNSVKSSQVVASNQTTIIAIVKITEIT